MMPIQQFFTRVLFRNIGVMAPVLMLIAGGTVYAAQRLVADAALTVATKRTTVGAQAVSLQQVAIKDDEALAIAQRLAVVAPTVRIALRGSTIVISTDSADQFAEWSHAMSAVQSMTQDVTWKADEICLVKCTGSAVARGTVVGYRQKLITQTQ